jgi:metalloendopeptidase OMA1, mitochondrial
MTIFPNARRLISGTSSWRWHWFFFAWTGLLAGLSVPGCGPPVPVESNRQGPGHRPQQLALTPEQELELGQRAYQEVLDEYRARILPADRPEVRRARDIAARIVRAARIEPLQREINLHIQGYKYEWQLNIIRSDKVNAFALPGGKIIVYTGILQVIENDDQLATVLSHEIAHVLAHHASERLAGEHPGIAGLLERLRYDRAQESEADHIGVFLMTFAGYNPEEAIRFWMRMERLSQDRGHLLDILSDHPSDAQRIHDLEAWVPRAEAAKRAYDQGHIQPEPGR